MTPYLICVIYYCNQLILLVIVVHSFMFKINNRYFPLRHTLQSGQDKNSYWDSKSSLHTAATFPSPLLFTSDSTFDSTPHISDHQRDSVHPKDLGHFDVKMSQNHQNDDFVYRPVGKAAPWPARPPQTSKKLKSLAESKKLISVAESKKVSFSFLLIASMARLLVLVMLQFFYFPLNHQLINV